MVIEFSLDDFRGSAVGVTRRRRCGANVRGGYCYPSQIFVRSLLETSIFRDGALITEMATSERFGRKKWGDDELPA